MEAQNNIKNWQWILTFFVVIVLVIGGIYLLSSRSSEEKIVTESVNDVLELENGTTTKNDFRILVDDQFPGNLVYISTVHSPENVFVAIHKNNSQVLGKEYGSTYMEKGTSPVRVTLSEFTKDGEAYEVVLYRDKDGDKKLSLDKDELVLDSNGNPIKKSFKVRKDIEEIKG